MRFEFGRVLMVGAVLGVALPAAGCSAGTPSSEATQESVETTEAQIETSIDGPISDEAATSPEWVIVEYRDDPVDVAGFVHLSGGGSSLVDAAWYDEPNAYLVVDLGSASYHYCDVPPGVWRSFGQADSLGGFYNRSIKGGYDCRTGTTVEETQQADPGEIAAATFDDWYLAERASVIGAHTNDRLAQVNESEDPSDLWMLSDVIALNSQKMKIVADMTVDSELREAIVLYSDATLAWSEVVSHKLQWVETGQEKHLDLLDTSTDSAVEMTKAAVDQMDRWAAAAVDPDLATPQSEYTDDFVASEAMTISAYSAALLEVAEESDDYVKTRLVAGMLADNANRLGRLADVLNGSPVLAESIRSLSGGWQAWSDAIYSRGSWLELDDDEFLGFYELFSAEAEASIKASTSALLASLAVDS